MNTPTARSPWGIRHLLLCLMPSLAISHANAEALLNPNQLTGTVRFTNTNPLIQQELSERGLGVAYMRADSIGLTPVLNNNMSLHLSGGSQFDYQMTVESSSSGIQYGVSADLRLDSRMERYLVDAQTSAPVFPEPAADASADIDQCAAMVDVRFVDTNGSPVKVSGGYMHAWRMVDNYSRLQAQDFAIPNGSSQDRLMIEGDGSDYRMDIVFDFGDDFYVDKVRNLCQRSFTAQCDEVIPVDCVVDGGPIEYGNIVGSVGVVGEQVVDQNHLTLMEATLGPLRNQRYDHVAGAGEFNLQNLVPSNIVDPAEGYIVYGQMGVGSGYDYQYLRTAFLYGNNGRVMVNPGETTDLGDTFVLKPGFVIGNIELMGPDTSSSALAYIYRDADTDSNGDGIPNNVYLSSSHVNAFGIGQKADGAQYNNGGAYTRTGFGGAFDSSNGAFTGDYRLVLGGLKGEASIWAMNDLVLRFENVGQRTSEDPFHSAYMSVHNNEVIYRQINPGETQQLDYHYCFNDIQLTYRSLSGTFYNPRLRANGQFQGEDYRGQPVDYRTSVTYARGLPLNQAAAASTGMVLLTLPQGQYDISPEVTAINPDGSLTNTELPALSLELGCGQVIKASTEVQVSINDLPQQTDSASITISGTINANAPVSTIDYVHNDRSPVNICSNGDCAATGEYSANVTLDQGQNQITVTANTGDGSQASVSFQIEYQEQEPVKPLTLSKCADQNVVAANGASATVSFNPMASGGCSSASVNCDSESGSLFTIGNHKVTCQASDDCGDTAQCSFAINVVAPEVDEPDASCDREENVRMEHSIGETLLWPPNHKLVDVEHSVALKSDCDQLSEELSQWQTGVEVWSNEPEAGEEDTGNNGTDNFAPDAKQADDVLRLRAERRGSGDGRVYLIIGYGEYQQQRYVTSCKVVTVPHSNQSASINSVSHMASAAKYYCEQNNGAAPEGYYQHGLSAEIGPKQ